MTDGTTQSAAVVGLSFTTRQNLTPSFTSPVLYYACPAYAHHRWALREPATRPRPSVRLSHASSSKNGKCYAVSRRSRWSSRPQRMAVRPPEVSETGGHIVPPLHGRCIDVSLVCHTKLLFLVCQHSVYFPRRGLDYAKIHVI